jgi:hypothetical protein
MAGVGYLGAVGGHDGVLGDVDGLDALPDADNERFAGEVAKGFSGEALRAEASRYDC